MGPSQGTIYVKAGVLDPYQRLGQALDSSAMSAGLPYLRGRRRRFELLHASQSGQLHHDHAPGGAPHGGSGAPGGSSHEAPCLFAASGKPAFAPAILTLETAASAAAPPEAYATAPVFLPTVLRAQSPRGPPLIA